MLFVSSQSYVVDRGTTSIGPRLKRGHRVSNERVPRRPAYEPVQFLVEPGAWDTDRPQWQTPRTDDEATLLAASMLQHRLSRRIWSELKTHKLRVEDLAASIGHGKDQLWRKLAGKAPAGLPELCLWAWLTGDDDAMVGVESAFEGRKPVWPTR